MLEPAAGGGCVGAAAGRRLQHRHLSHAAFNAARLTPRNSPAPPWQPTCWKMALSIDNRNQAEFREFKSRSRACYEAGEIKCTARLDGWVLPILAPRSQAVAILALSGCTKICEARLQPNRAPSYNRALPSSASSVCGSAAQHVLIDNGPRNPRRNAPSPRVGVGSSGAARCRCQAAASRMCGRACRPTSAPQEALLTIAGWAQPVWRAAAGAFRRSRPSKTPAAMAAAAAPTAAAATAAAARRLSGGCHLKRGSRELWGCRLSKA